MPHWPRDVLLVAIGPIKSGYRDELMALATTLGMSERVFLPGRVPYEDLFSLSVGAAIGVSIVSPDRERNLSWTYSAGAVNKRYEYMALGKPQVSNRGPGMQALIEAPGVGMLINPEDSDAFGAALNAILSDPARAAEMGRRARARHLEIFNYETQFAAILAAVNDLLQRRERALCES